MEKTHWKKVFNSEYLGSCDLEDGKDIRATIKNVVIKKVKNTDGKETDRNVAYFTDPNLKPMVLNATNCKILKKFCNSPWINDWVNMAVQIYVKDDVKAFGDITEGLRFREYKPSDEKPKLTFEMPAYQKALELLKSKTKTIADIEKVYTLTKEVRAELLKIIPV
jgi:hypothetical protein